MNQARPFTTKKWKHPKKQMVKILRIGYPKLYIVFGYDNYGVVSGSHWFVEDYNVMDLNDFIQNNYKDSIERKVDEEGNPVIDNKSLQELLGWSK